MLPIFRMIIVLIQKILAGIDLSRVCQDALIKDSCRDEVKLAIGCPDLVEMHAMNSPDTKECRL